MEFKDPTPEQIEKTPDESRELNDEELVGVAGGAQAYEDPREKNPDKKDDPKEW